MADEGEWGPWIEHDGAGVNVPGQCVLEIEWADGLGKYVPKEGATIDVNTYPGFFWRWKTVRAGWFRSERKRVCDDPDYAPIIRYRIRKPRGLTILESLLENLPEGVDA